MTKNAIITFPTNLNKKLDSRFFLHIALAPPAPMAESDMRNTWVKIKVADGSYDMVSARLVDFWRLQLSVLSSILTYPSHGMSGDEFRVYIQHQHPRITREEWMAVYLYEKTN